jgi:hypothetical protein
MTMTIRGQESFVAAKHRMALFYKPMEDASGPKPEPVEIQTLAIQCCSTLIDRNLRKPNCVIRLLRGHWETACLAALCSSMILVASSRGTSS